MANPPPVSSTPGILTREHLLQLYPNLDDSEVIKQVQELRKAGNHAHKSMDNHSAIKMYTEAISLIGTRKEFLHEAAILYSNRSAAYHDMMKYIDALTDALASLNCDPKWHRGYERKAKALKCLTQFADAYKSFLDGFFQSDDPDNKVKENFLFEAVCLLHLIEGTEIKKEYDLLKEVDKKWWGPLLVRLGNDGKWCAIGYLMIGPDLMNLKDQRYNEAETLVIGVAAGVSTNGVPLKTLFEFLKQLDTKTDARWLDRLILMLMESSVPDARLHSLREDEKDGDLHAVVRFSLMTGGTSTLNHILNKFRAETLREPGSDIMLDGNSDTVFHTMAKFRPHPEPSVLKRTAELMLGAGLNAAVKNKEGKLPVDCLDKKYKGEIFDLFRKASGKLTPTDIAQLKQEGNMKFEAHDCVGAGKSYSQAIQILEENSCRMPTGLNYHDISDLYASRAAVFLGQEKYQEALNDAKKSVFHDQQFYRGHICIGSALRGLQRFEESLQSLNNALIVALRQHDNIKVDIIMELTRTYQLLPRRKFPLDARLYNTTSLIWFRAAYNFILHNEWNMAFVAYLQAAMSVDVKAHFPLDSKPLCNVEKAKKYPWLMHMLYYLVWYRSDYKKISCYPGDTYFHAVAYMTIKAGNIKNKMSLALLKYIMNEFVIKNKEQNIVDSNGDTVLHIVAHEPCNDARFRRQIIMFLAENDVNPFIKNKDGKTVKDKTYNIHLRNVQTLISSIQELWKDSHKDLSEMTDYKQKQAHSQAKNKSKKGKGKEESPENRLQGQDQGTVAVPRNRFVQCDWCVNLLQGSEHDFSKGNQDGGYQKLIKVLEHKHQSNQQSITAEVINAIVGKLRETTPPEIPDCFTSMSETMYKLITMELIKLKKWRLLDAAVCKYQKKHGSDKLKSFASSIDIVDVIGDTNLRAEDMPQVVILMLDNGAALGKDGGIKAVQAAVGQGHFKVIVELLKRDANPSAVSLTDGDTPLHAALRIVLEKDKDSLTLFEALLCKFDSDPVKFACLDPSQVDANGDSLFHLLAKCTFSSAVLKVIETLCKRKLTSSVRNLDGKLPVDYITEEKDRRKQFLRMVATTDASKVKKISIDKMSFINEKTGDETIRNVRKAINPSTEREELKNRIKEKIKLLEDSKSSVFSLSTVKPSSPGATQKHHESKAILKCPTLSGLETEQTSAPTEQKVEETAESLCKKDEEQLNAWETKPEDTFDTVGMEAEEGRTEEEETEEITIDAKVFDGLPWEVECTEDVWKKLRDKRVSSNMKKRIVESFRLLANGDWSPHLCKQLRGVPSGLQLYEAKVSKAGRVLWQLAIAFSPRCSRTAEQHLSGQEKRTPCPDSGGRIYSEIIRIWDIVPDHDRLYRSVQLAVQRIIKSHDRGETCIIQKKLLPSSVTETPMGHKVPRLFAEAQSDLEHLQEEEHKLLQKYFPPASPKETEYHILKFYTFNSALISHILQNIDIKVDFPFRVTDLEHDIIMLSSTSPILLLGRSGTGKTTCCLYRLWTLFLNYWEKAKDPFLPRIVEHKVEEKGGNEEEKEVEEKEIKEHDGEDGVKRVLDDKDMKPGPGAVCGEMPQDENSEDNDQQQYIHLRQIFVTKNAVLCKEMQKNFNNLCHACDSVRDHMKQEEEKLPNMLQEVDCHSYPLFLTSRQLLLMLDASVGTPYFFDRKTDGSLKACIQGWSDDDDDPLSILSLLEEDSDIEGDEEGYNYSDSEREEEEDQKEEALGTSQTKLDPKREVTYEVFVQEVWPQMKNKDSYHPTLVWTEFISFIKGSYEALSQPKGYVSKETYHRIGKKRAPHFPGERDKIYELFRQYNNIMRQNKLFDETDLIHNVYTRIQNLKGEQLFDIHQIFVDEIQDFTQAEQYLLIQICKNPNQMFLTGDTAQSIMRGISFRFEDLKSLFYHAKEATQTKWKKEAVQVPKQVYQLVQNYRSHEGILSLASSILDLLVEFFPESFDPLKKDQGLFSDGPHPILIESSSFSDLAMLLRGNRRKTSAIEFGAHQAVLVVNEAARESIPEELKLGLVLTIYEAKGLEFDDVLLYNFFKDSQADKEWRVVTEYLEELLSNQKDSQQGASYIASKSLVEIDESVLQQEGRSRPLPFDPNLHKVLNSELKHLYTALTRARVNVWIFDEDPNKRAPMFQYFKARKLVKSLGKLDESNLTDVMFAEKSSQEDWIHRGKDFQKNALYEVAAKCFGIAGETAKQKVALAHHGALVASRLKDNPHAMCHEFLKVAELYLECDRPDKAAICLKNARERELAAQLLEKLGKFEEAAGLYRRMKRPLDSSRCFEFMWNFNRAVEVLYENEYYDEVIDTQHRYKLKRKEYESRGEPIPQYLLTNEPQEKFSEERVSYKAADKHHRTNNPKKMMDALDRLPRWEDRVDFLKKNNYVDDAVEILEKHGKVEEATNLLLIHGKIKEAETVARKTLDESTLAQTLLVCSRVLMSQQQERCSSTEELQKMVKETKEIFVRCKNADGSAEASLQLADLAVSKSDIAQSEIYFRQAWNLFCDSKPYSNLPGSLECVEWFVTHTPITKDNFKYLVQAFDHLFKVVQILCCQKSSVDEELSNYDRFYGLIDSKKDSVICYPKQIPRCKSMISDMLSSQQKMVEIEINKNKANEKLALYLLNRAKHWLKVAIEGILRIRNQFQQCHYYQIGHSCPHMEKQEERCPKLHRAHTRETFNALIGTDRSFIELQRNIEFGARTLIETNLSSLDEHIKYFLSYQVTTSLGDNISKFTSCQMILDDLPPRSQCVHVFFKRYPSEFLRPMNAPLRQYIQAFVEEEWKKATDGDKKFDTAAARSANTFLMIEFCCHLIPINFNFGKRLADFENALSQEQYSWNSHRKWNSFALMKDFKDRDVNKEGGRMLIVQSLAHRFSDSYSHLTKADPFEALVKFTKFIALIQTKEQKVLPEPKFLVMWMEFYTILAFFLIAKVHKEIQGNSSELQDAFFFVPASYLHLMDFIEATFPKSTTFIQKAVHLTQRKYDEKFIQDRLHYFVKLLCDKAESLMLVSAHFSADHDSTISCAEEALVLTMTLVSNVGTFVSKESETALMQTLSRLKVPDKCPNRVMLALKAVQNAQGVRDVGIALRELLNKREDEHFICCKWIPISRQKGQRVFIHTYKLTSVDPLPVNFLGQNTLAAMHHDSGLVQQLTESLGDQEEEMSMSMEEKMMLDRDIAQEQEEIILKERETKLEDLHARDKQDEQMNILETTELTDVYCVPCNISYEELIKQRCHFSDVEVKSVSYVEMEQQLTPDMANVSKALKMNAISGRNDMTENEEISGTVNLTQSLASRLPDTTQSQWDATNSSEQEGNRKDNAISDGKCGPLRDYSVDASESRTKLTYPADENATDYTRSFSYDPSAEIGDTAQPTEEEIKEMRKMELRLIKEEHVKSPEHIQKENEFDSFQKLCQTVEAQVKKMQDVIQQYELNNPDMRNAAYSHKLIYINRIENCMESIINEKNKIRKERSWHKTGDLETMLTEMRQACDMVLHNVEDEYNKFKQEEKERQEPRAMRRMISETDNVEIEEVVKQPQNYNSKRKNKKPRRGHKR